MQPDFGMFRFMRFVDWFLDTRDKVFFLFENLFDSIGQVFLVFSYIPDFVFTIVVCMVSVAVIMWVVNLL